ncbi:unnamed protein product [Paramecium pentaurelia]|uniref:Uncharacterized protein n=1 Tax=Paramecium pentaurelia TaxID=43138 RepID=A0A8S1VDM9_9CILI|nr:unnamed protein product [Paramecium pentaurelia]
MLSPLIISTLIETTITEGIFSTCIACIFSMKIKTRLNSIQSISMDTMFSLLTQKNGFQETKKLYLNIQMYHKFHINNIMGLLLYYI